MNKESRKMKRGRFEDDDDVGGNASSGDPRIELGEDIAVPVDWQQRGTFLQTDFELLERDGLRFYHHVNGLFVVFLGPSHPLLQHPSRQTLQLQFTADALNCLQVKVRD